MLTSTFTTGPCGHRIMLGEIPCTCGGLNHSQCPYYGHWENLSCSLCTWISGNHGIRDPVPLQASKWYKPCLLKYCDLDRHDSGEHLSRSFLCKQEGCYLPVKHTRPHTEPLWSSTSRDLTKRYEDKCKKAAKAMKQLNIIVLRTMTDSEDDPANRKSPWAD
jgi:hypothetical protein